MRNIFVVNLPTLPRTGYSGARTGVPRHHQAGAPPAVTRQRDGSFHLSLLQRTDPVTSCYTHSYRVTGLPAYIAFWGILPNFKRKQIPRK